MNPWKRLGLQIHLAQDKYEQKFVNSLATYSSSWLRIKFDNNEVKTDDQFQGKTGSFFDDWNIIKKWSFLKTGLINHFQKPTKDQNQQSLWPNYIGKDWIQTSFTPEVALFATFQKNSDLLKWKYRKMLNMSAPNRSNRDRREWDVSSTVFTIITGTPRPDLAPIWLRQPIFHEYIYDRDAFYL